MGFATILEWEAEEGDVCVPSSLSQADLGGH